MKRLIAFTCALAMLLTMQNIVFTQTADAAAAIRKLDAGTFIGMTEAALKAKYGSPVRREPSEYGFTWYVYNRDYANFFMAGVKSGRVVAVYASAKVMSYKGKFKFNSTKSTVRSKMGSPISYVRSGNKVVVLNNRAQRDYFKVGTHYVIAFYDLLSGSKVTSVLILPQTYQNTVLLRRPALSAGLLAAYERISVDLINASRVRRGYRKLATDTLDTRLARSRSADMRNRNYFSHYTPAPNSVSPFTQARRMGIHYTSMGENISFGETNAIFAHEAFMNSAGHRSNILKAGYTKVGAGAAYGSSRYSLLTNIFTR